MCVSLNKNGPHRTIEEEICGTYLIKILAVKFSLNFLVTIKIDHLANLVHYYKLYSGKCAGYHLKYYWNNPNFDNNLDPTLVNKMITLYLKTLIYCKRCYFCVIKFLHWASPKHIRRFLNLRCMQFSPL